MKPHNALMFAAKFRQLMEYSNHFNQSFKQRQKQDFKNWQNKGYEILKGMGINENEPITDAIVEALENCAFEIEKQLEKELKK
jgi:hypothetical protein